eukprot:7003994-Alexandrium_andersonii.AAC.1
MLVRVVSAISARARCVSSSRARLRAERAHQARTRHFRGLESKVVVVPRRDRSRVRCAKHGGPSSRL